MSKQYRRLPQIITIGSCKAMTLAGYYDSIDSNNINRRAPPSTCEIASELQLSEWKLYYLSFNEPYSPNIESANVFLLEVGSRSSFTKFI